MAIEQKTCLQCNVTFTIDERDQVFYEKMAVPAPTWCPECRLQRRLLWRNERMLYRRPCNAPGHTEEMVSIFAPDKSFPVYCQPFWWSDGWDATAYGRDHDFSRPFFEQYRELLQVVPKAALSSNYSSMINSEYSNWSGWCKNCYLLFDADYVEDSAYGSGVFKSKDCFDCDNIAECELCYGSFNLTKCYRTIASVDCQNCNEVRWCKNCTGCTNCFGCVNLRNKQYHIFNKPYAKEDYFKELARLDPGSRAVGERAGAEARGFWLQFPQKYYHGYGNEQSSGDYLYHSKNSHYTFLASAVEDSKFIALIHSLGTKDCYDYTDWGEQAERLYECMTVGIKAFNVKFSHLTVISVRDIEYSYFCTDSADLFGCAGVRKKQYCILNQQYTKEEYTVMVDKIKRQMDAMPYVDAQGRTYKYGEYFPPDLAPFAYNESVAYEFYLRTKEEALSQGYRWVNMPKRTYNPTILPENIPDEIGAASVSLVKEVFGCAHSGSCAHLCTEVFKLLPKELEYLKANHVPLPNLCPNCRHFERMVYRNPLRLWRRICGCFGEQSKNGIYKNTAAHFHGILPCIQEVEAAYPPDSPNIVYCEACYQSEAI